jgi:uncharacterized protein
MEAIYIPHLLRAYGKKQEIIVDQTIASLDSLTPVRGKIKLRHGGTFLEVAATAETIVTLTCDRCLKQYNHKLNVNTSEIIWLDKEAEEGKVYPLEREVSLEDLAESLPATGHFQPETWLYEQLCLALPLRQICSIDCNSPLVEEKIEKNQGDSRWSILETLKGKLSTDN